MSAQDNLTIIRDLFDTWNKGERDRAMTFFDANAESLDMATGIRLRGQQEIRQYYESLAKAMPDLTPKINNIFGNDEYVCVEYVSTGTLTGPMDLPNGRIQPTGRRSDFPQCDVYQLRNGKIVAVRTYSDYATLMKQLGVPFGSQKAA